MTTLNTNSLATHRTESGAHPASSISVTNNFTHAAGTDLQTILSGLDSAIGARRNQEGELIEDVGDEITARTAADTAEATTRAAGDDEVRASEISRAGDSIYGDLTFYTDDTLATQTMSIAPTTGDITTQGQFSALGGMFTIELDPATSEPIVSIDNAGGVETYRFEAETGSLTLLGDLTMADADILMSPGRLVDGVDISALNLRLPPGGTPLDDIYVNVTGDTMTGPLTATSFTGDGANITNIDGGNIQTNTITNTQIGEDAVGSSEIAADAVGSSEIATDAVGSDEIAENAVNSSEIVTGAVGSDEIANGTIALGDLGTNGCTNGKVIKYDNGWVCGDDIDTDTDTNTTYTAGDGLTLTDTEFDVVFGGTGSVLTTAHSDHNHDVTYAPSSHDHPHTHDYAPPHDHPYAPAGHTHDPTDVVPQQQRAFAHGSAGGASGCSGYNISGPAGPFGVSSTITCNFDNDAPSTNYTVVVTHRGGGCASGVFLRVTDKDAGDFTVTANCSAGPLASAVLFDFAVYRRD